MQIKNPASSSVLTERGSTGTAYNKYTKNMDKNYFIEVFSFDRMCRYFDAYPENDGISLTHYQCNIQISEAFYPCISVLEVALRNSINRQLSIKFNTPDWYSRFPNIPGLEKLMQDVETAQSHLIKRRESISPPKVVAELTLGFWVRLFNAEFERILWKDLRRAFPYLHKSKRQRKHISAPLNNFRILRNRIFHNEPICWNLNRLEEIHKEMLRMLSWINKDLPGWIQPLDRFQAVLKDITARLNN